MTTSNIARLALLLVTALSTAACDAQTLMNNAGVPAGPTSLDSNPAGPSRPNPPTGPQTLTGTNKPTSASTPARDHGIGGLTNDPRPSVPATPRVTS